MWMVRDAHRRQPMSTDAAEIKRRFDGTHDKGTLTFAAVGASPAHGRVTMFLEAVLVDNSRRRTTRVEYQLTGEQAKTVLAMLSQAVGDLSPGLA